MTEETKQPPNAIGPEKSVLSSILQDPVEYAPRAVEMGLTPQAFYHPGHAVLFSALVDRQARGGTIELVGMTDDMMKDGTLERLGGPAALAEIYTYAPTSAHFAEHAKSVLDCAVLRAVIRFGTRIVSEAYQTPEVSDIVSRVELGALTLGKDAQDRSGYDYSLKTAYRELLQLLESDKGEGIPTGWPAVDQVTGGLHPGEVMVVGARPAMGKTSFAMSLAENLALHQGVPTALFAVEGKRTYLTTRLTAMACHLPAKRIRDKTLNRGDILKIKAKMKDTKQAPFFMDDRISNAVEIAAKIRRMHQQTPLKVVLIDYIQKLPAALPDERSNLRLRIINATDVLHQTCKALDIALVLLAQLGRDTKEADPEVSSLKESGSLEQDADTIILLGRKGDDPDDPNTPREKLIRIGKNRHGPCADLTLQFNPPTTRFY